MPLDVEFIDFDDVLSDKLDGFDVVINAGFEGSVVIAAVKEAKPGTGFNADTEVYEDMIKAGIVDPTKVARSALQNAASASALLLTTEAGIVPIPEKADPAAAAAAAAGGMGGMM